MNKIFIDSNIWFYSFIDKEKKTDIASAFLSDCSMLYSEDMQNDFVFEKTLKIVNPLIARD